MKFANEYYYLKMASKLQARINNVLCLLLRDGLSEAYKRQLNSKLELFESQLDFIYKK